MALKRVCGHDNARAHNVINEHDARAIKVIKYLLIGLQKTDKGV